MKKDWTGNQQSIFTTLGASNHTESVREPNDFYATDPVAIDRLLDAVGMLPHHVWECACGQGHLSKRLIERGYDVYSSDLIDRGYGNGGADFLTSTLPTGWADTDDVCILTNPPFRYATEFVLHALDVLPQGQPAYFLLRTTFLEGKNRFEKVYRHGYLSAVYQFSQRVLCAKNGDFDNFRIAGGSAVSYAWFEFRRQRLSNPYIVFI